MLCRYGRDWRRKQRRSRYPNDLTHYDHLRRSSMRRRRLRLKGEKIIAIRGEQGKHIQMILALTNPTVADASVQQTVFNPLNILFYAAFKDLSITNQNNWSVGVRFHSTARSGQILWTRQRMSHGNLQTCSKP